MHTRRFEILYFRPSGVAHRALRILFATGIGVVFGFQSWRIARYGFSLSLPWYVSAAIMLTYLLLGLTIGETARGKWSWLQGLFLGAIFSLPTASGAIWLGLRWMPYGVTALVCGCVAGYLTALITQAVFRST